MAVPSLPIDLAPQIVPELRRSHLGAIKACPARTCTVSALGYKRNSLFRSIAITIPICPGESIGKVRSADNSGCGIFTLSSPSCSVAAWRRRPCNSASLSLPCRRVIADLEHALGVRLLDRNPQGVEPTVFGTALLKRGTAAFDELKQGIRDI